MRHIRSYIDDAKNKVVGGDSRVKNLVKDIQELAGDVEDLLDEFHPKIPQSNNCKGAICCLKTACIFRCACFAYEFAMEIEKIKIRVVDIDHVRTTYIIHTSNSNNNQHDCIPLERRKLFLHADEIEAMTLDDDSRKTTLAKKLYGHVRDQFECSRLVYISKQPIAGEILLDIAQQVGVMEGERKDNLQGNLQLLLKRKRYVIPLDDIWDVEILDDLKLVLPECDLKIGSKIIIISRNSNIGGCIGGDFSRHVLEPLDLEKSFELFTKKIFNFHNNSWANASLALVNIGRNLVERCGGIPLAIVVTAGILRARERTEHAWNGILESMDNKIQDGCAKVLALSCNDLPTTLRPCFMYFGLLPEDNEILASDLTNIWIAKKLIVVNSDNKRETEDLADNFLTDLVSRNLIQVSKRTYDGRISSRHIHDLLHGLCVVLGKETNFFQTEHNAFGDPDNVFRLKKITLYSDNVMNEFFCSNSKPKKLRALFCFTKDLRHIFSQKDHLDFKLLQVLVVVMP